MEPTEMGSDETGSGLSRPTSKARDEINRRVATTDPDFDHLNQLLSIVREQDDRGVVLSLAAFAEDTLGRLLLTYLVEGKQAEHLVDGFNAPLGTLSARTKAAYAIGLLTREQYEDLEIARKVRNASAHDWQGVTFERQDIRTLIARLHAYTFDGVVELTRFSGHGFKSTYAASWSCAS